MSATNSTDGLQFRLSEGTEGADRREALPAPPTSPLSDEAVANLLKRLPAFRAGDGKTEPDDEAGFAMRDRSLPPPKTGQTITAAFTPASIPGAPASSGRVYQEELRRLLRSRLILVHLLVFGYVVMAMALSWSATLRSSSGMRATSEA